MIQTEMRIPVREIYDGYTDDPDKGCYAYSGRLCVRPDYQREFVYKDAQRDLVVDTVMKGMPLGIMYWMKKPDGSFELMDGQQRTLSLLQYLAGGFSIDYRFFHNLDATEQAKLLDYNLLVYACEGTDKERQEWFRRINVAGAVLTDQEMRNAVYAGPWCTDARKYFSKPGGPAYSIGQDWLSGSALRQDYLETALAWICDRDGIAIEEYMAKHQRDKTALELWSYFRSVLDWAESLFGSKDKSRKKLLKGLPWGEYFNKYGKNSYDPAALEAEIASLLKDEDVTAQKGVYEYVLSGKTEEKLLHIRAFSDKDKRRKYEEQGYRCPMCLAKGVTAEYAFEDMQGDHIIPWSKGGHTEYSNLQMLCRKCNNEKGGK